MKESGITVKGYCAKCATGILTRVESARLVPASAWRARDTTPNA
jgi:hypothetical protein